ncbi:NAD(P)/FAD-dependent oxidoreductase [Nocardioides sp. cx-173]|uniref:phytoene desaturase family protein n=1 Tax=Nocardioides sp. cx-173 TaxID=2898796 RepID=UPI001E2A0235|nr:NAD(P)/FAD-dependent oxidoreductase [Nocardioides sp. cx-173]MCD4524019.1 NAD(P)/FAD-dependent oxidoreductase [Nocardioides sp. cx-173]UGB41420.1 NAD(P)/FAD-dependent oxidoreductase [Nocardioides sp. cx-173]
MSRSVIVVGGGHNGLVAAVRLARAGCRVTVLEQGVEPGGCVWTETHPSGVVVERGAWEHAGVLDVARELELDVDYVEHPVAAGFHFADGTQRVFHTDLEHTVRELGADGPAYRRLVDLADTLFGLLDTFATPPTPAEVAAALAAVPGGDALFRTMVQSAETVIEATLTDPFARAALALQASHAQVPAWAPGTGLFAFLLPLAHGGPSVRPLGGSRALVDGLVAALEAAGGTVRTSAPVVRLSTHRRRGAAFGGGLDESGGGGGGEVELADGTVLAADVVVSTLGLPRTGSLLTDPAPALRAAASDLHSGHFNVSELTATVVSSAPVPLPWDDTDAIWYAVAEPGDVRRGFGEILAGQLPTSPWSMVGGVRQPAGVAGAATWLSSVVPLDPADGPWTAERERLAGERLVDHVSSVLGVDLRAGLVDLVVSGPATWAGRVGGDGSPNHLDNTLDQLLGWRVPGHADLRTELPWLFLAGAGSHPGGGLSGASGSAVATTVLSGAATPPRAERLRAEVRGLVRGFQAYRSLRKGIR